MSVEANSCLFRAHSENEKVFREVFIYRHLTLTIKKQTVVTIRART